jgi:hypothetical protein
MRNIGILSIAFGATDGHISKIKQEVHFMLDTRNEFYQ